MEIINIILFVCSILQLVIHQSMPKEVGWDDDKERVWITNYK